MVDIDALNVSLSRWDVAAYFAFAGVLIGVIGESILEFTEWIPELATLPNGEPASTFRRKFGRASAFLLIAGIGGEIVTHAATSHITSVITAELDRQGKTAEKLANEARERAEALEAANLQQRKIIDDQKRRLDKHEKQLAPREVDPDSARAFVKAVNGKKRGMALIIPNDPEPRAFAVESLKPMFDRAGFIAKPEDLGGGGTSKYTGIVVCINSEPDRIVFQELKKAHFVVRGFDDKMPERPDFCDALPGSLPIRVFVGQRAFPPKAK